MFTLQINKLKQYLVQFKFRMKHHRATPSEPSSLSGQQKSSIVVALNTYNKNLQKNLQKNALAANTKGRGQAQHYPHLGKNKYISNSPQPYSGLKQKKTNLMVYGFSSSNNIANDLGNPHEKSGNVTIKSLKQSSPSLPLAKSNFIQQKDRIQSHLQNSSGKPQDTPYRNEGLQQQSHSLTGAQDTKSKYQLTIGKQQSHSQEPCQASSEAYHYNNYQDSHDQKKQSQNINNQRANLLDNNGQDLEMVEPRTCKGGFPTSAKTPRQQAAFSRSNKAQVLAVQSLVNKNYHQSTENGSLTAENHATLGCSQSSLNQGRTIKNLLNKPNARQLSMNLSALNKHVQKRTFDLTGAKPKTYGDSPSQERSSKETQITDAKWGINNSFTDKKQSTKWTLMNSKQVRNQSEPNINQFQPNIKKDQLQQINEDYCQVQAVVPNAVRKFSCKTRKGYLPNTKKVNQDSFIILKDFAGIKNCWMCGVLDGHGVNGHQVSDFVKKTLPAMLTALIDNKVIESTAIPNQGPKKKNSYGVKPFLPPLVSSFKREQQPLLEQNQLSNPYQMREDTKQSAKMINEGLSQGSEQQEVKNSKQNWMTSDPLIRDLQIREAFKLTEEKLEHGAKIDSMFSGTTAVVVLIWNDIVVCANSGDSRAILSSQNTAGIWNFQTLSRDHKPEDNDEAARVKKAGGRIEQSRLSLGLASHMGMKQNQVSFFGPLRVWLKHKQVPGLAMTRSLGDLVAKSVGVTYDPEIKCVSGINKDDKFIVIGSDGLWDRIPNDEVTRIVASPYFQNNDAEGAATHLMNESVNRWQRDQGMIDDITIIVIFLNTNAIGSQTKQVGRPLEQDP